MANQDMIVINDSKDIGQGESSEVSDSEGRDVIYDIQVTTESPSASPDSKTRKPSLRLAPLETLTLDGFKDRDDECKTPQAKVNKLALPKPMLSVT